MVRVDGNATTLGRSLKETSSDVHNAYTAPPNTRAFQ